MNGSTENYVLKILKLKNTNFRKHAFISALKNRKAIVEIYIKKSVI